MHRAQRRFAETGSYEDPEAIPLLLDGEEVVAGWDADLNHLLAEAAEARSGIAAVRLPEQLSTTAVLRLREDPQAYAAELARPMPRPPSRAARFGTRFHQWVERYFSGSLPSGGLGQQQLVDPDELSDRADFGQPDELELRELCEGFAAGQFGAAVPYAIEAPFTFAAAGRLIRGRIDAVYRRAPGENGARFTVIDWKTSAAETADHWQLAIYRLAWAEAQQLPLDEVEAAFYYVRSDRLVRPDRLPDRQELEQVLNGDVTRLG